jgi:hypothetical protein
VPYEKWRRKCLEVEIFGEAVGLKQQQSYFYLGILKPGVHMLPFELAF